MKNWRLEKNNSPDYGDATRAIIDDDHKRLIMANDMYYPSVPAKDSGAWELIAAAPKMLNELESILSWALLERAPLRETEIQSILRVIREAKGLTV